MSRVMTLLQRTLGLPVLRGALRDSAQRKFLGKRPSPIRWTLPSQRRRRCLTWASAEILPLWKVDILIIIWVTDNAMQMDLHKTLYPFFTAKQIPHEARAPFASFQKSYSSGVVYEFSKRVYLLPSFTAFAELGYNPVSLLLWTADFAVWIGFEIFTTTFVVLSLVCADWTSLLNLSSEMFSALSLTEMLFLLVNYLIPWPSPAGGTVVPGLPIWDLCPPPFHVWSLELPWSCRIAMRNCK